MKNLFLFAVSVMVSVIILEIALRVILPSPITWKHPQEHYVRDPEIGHWMEPDQQAFTHDKVVHINSVGIRDKEYTEQAQKGVYRILALGDSQTFGNGLELSDTWPKQLESLLNDYSKDIGYEVINSGLPGSDTWQHEIILQRMISRYHPDAVILAFYVNDVFRSTKNNFNTKNKLESKVTYLLKSSALLLTFRIALRSIRQSLFPSDWHLKELALLKGTNDISFDKLWQQVNSSLSRMKLVCDREKIKFIIASLPRRDQISGQLPWEGYHKRLQTIASRLHIPLINMLEPLQESYDDYGKALFIPWDGHNSKLANKIVAESLAASFLKSN